MAGKFLTTRNINFIQNWIDEVSKSNLWEGNNLHIDELRKFKKNEKLEWLDFSILLLKNTKQKFKFNNSLFFFLHIDLKYDSTKLCLKELNFKWLEENISDFTPPSLNFTSKEYFDSFYKKELISFEPGIDFKLKLEGKDDLIFFYRSYFDLNEELFSREIYIFKTQ